MGMPRLRRSWALASSPPDRAMKGSRIGVLMKTGWTELQRTFQPPLAASRAMVLVYIQTAALVAL